MPPNETRDTRLAEALALGDTAAIVKVYEEAAEAQGNDQASAFFLTQAYIHAVEAGLPEARNLRAKLVKMGRETMR